MLAAAGVEHVAELGRELEPVAVRREHPADELLVGPLAVRVAGLEEGDPELERLEQEALAGPLADVAPPGRAERPGAESDLGGLEVGIAEAAHPHGRKCR